MAFIAAFVLVYLADMAIYQLRGSPQSTVTVNRYITVPLKGNKTEFDYQGTLGVACSVSLFPQGDETPCWQLRRHPNQNTPM